MEKEPQEMGLVYCQQVRTHKRVPDDILELSRYFGARIPIDINLNKGVNSA